MTGMNNQWRSDQTISDPPARAPAFHVRLHRGDFAPSTRPTTGSGAFCARATRGQITAARPSAEMNCRRLMSIAICPVPTGFMPAAIWGQEYHTRTLGLCLLQGPVVKRLAILLHCVRPFMALSGHQERAAECPLLGEERTWRLTVRMSTFDPKRTLLGAVLTTSSLPV